MLDKFLIDQYVVLSSLGMRADSEQAPASSFRSQRQSLSNPHHRGASSATNSTKRNAKSPSSSLSGREPMQLQRQPKKQECEDAHD